VKLPAPITTLTLSQQFLLRQVQEDVKKLTKAQLEEYCVQLASQSIVYRANMLNLTATVLGCSLEELHKM